MNNAAFNITAGGVGKRFGRRSLFRDISVSLATGDSLAITGPNGSGKSTIMQVLAGLQLPTAGTIEWRSGGAMVPRHELPAHAGFISPLVNPYDELTGLENIYFVLRKDRGGDRVMPLLERFGLVGHEEKQVRHYSSGMKQRLKFICAVINGPPVLFLDEPGTNLDQDGKKLQAGYIEEVRENTLILIATNEKDEVKLCRKELPIGR